MNRFCPLRLLAVAPAFLVLISTQTQARSEEKPEFLRARTLATNVCSQCHLFPDPVCHDRATWRDKIEPLMRLKMGMPAIEKNPSPNARALTEVWHAIWDDYYLVASPEQALPQDPRPPITPDLTLFKVEDPRYEPLNSYATLVQIDTNAHQVYVGNAITKTVDVLDAQGRRLASSKVDSTLVHLFARPGGGWIGTQIGYVPPSDQPLGRVTLFTKKDNRFETQYDLLTSLVRPVHTTMVPLVAGQPDLVVCSFGSTDGRLAWYAPASSPTNFVEHVLFQRPGAILSRVIDFNHDGKPDLVVLSAQGKEGIFLYVNKGNGQFEERPLIQQPPVWGYVYFELADFNGDGFPDIIAANGDLGDFTCPPKKYHGVRIYLNDGNWNFKETWFYPLNGAYKCVVADFDGDGDLDIAAFSFFPDYEKSPEESFVYFENVGGMKFIPHTFPDCARGRWLVMDVGDLDGDGDLDIVLGGAYKVPFKTPQSFTERWQKDGPSILILRNQLAERKAASRR